MMLYERKGVFVIIEMESFLFNLRSEEERASVVTICELNTCKVRINEDQWLIVQEDFTVQ